MSAYKLTGAMCAILLMVSVPASFPQTNTVKDVMKGTGQQIKTGANKLESVVKKGLRQNKTTIKKKQLKPKNWVPQKVFKNSFKE